MEEPFEIDFAKKKPREGGAAKSGGARRAPPRVTTAKTRKSKRNSLAAPFQGD